MKAMILAAGLGTRLRPLTDSRPKALVEINGLSLLEITLARLNASGVNDVIVNAHHFADMIVDYLKVHNNFGMKIVVSREEELLDTGGGLKKAAWFFQEETARTEQPFILHNVDVLSTIDLQRMMQQHAKDENLVTLAVQTRESSRQLLFDENLQLCGRKKEQETEIVRETSADPEQFAFTGIHVISPKLLHMFEEDGVFSIVETYLRLAGQGENIAAFRADEYYWRDVGRLEDLRQAAQDLKQKNFN